MADTPGTPACRRSCTRDRTPARSARNRTQGPLRQRPAGASLSLRRRRTPPPPRSPRSSCPRRRSSPAPSRRLRGRRPTPDRDRPRLRLHAVDRWRGLRRPRRRKLVDVVNHLHVMRLSIPVSRNQWRVYWSIANSYSCLRRGSHLSRSQSPMKLKASTVRYIATPGKTPPTRRSPGSLVRRTPSNPTRVSAAAPRRPES